MSKTQSVMDALEMIATGQVPATDTERVRAFEMLFARGALINRNTAVSAAAATKAPPADDAHVAPGARLFSDPSKTAASATVPTAWVRSTRCFSCKSPHLAQINNMLKQGATADGLSKWLLDNHGIRIAGNSIWSHKTRHMPYQMEPPPASVPAVGPPQRVEKGMYASGVSGNLGGRPVGSGCASCNSAHASVINDRLRQGVSAKAISVWLLEHGVKISPDAILNHKAKHMKPETP